MLICRAPPKTSMKDTKLPNMSKVILSPFVNNHNKIQTKANLLGNVLPLVLHLVCDTSFTRRRKSFTFHEGCKSLNWSRNRNMSRAISSP